MHRMLIRSASVPTTRPLTASGGPSFPEECEFPGEASPPPVPPPAPDTGPIRTDDTEFYSAVRQLRRTRDFLLQEGVSARIATGSPEEPSAFALGQLNRVRYSPGGAPASLSDWELLETHQDRLQRLFDPELQRRFRMQDTQRLITIVPVSLLVVAGIALFWAVFPGMIDFLVSPAAVRLVAFLAWTVCLGGLGAVGFLAVNSLAIQADATFDISSKALVQIRMVLGGLFGSVVSLPFGYGSFATFVDQLVAAPAAIEASQGAMLLLPFLLGFSTSLVLAVLGRLVAGVETVLGIQRPDSARPNAPGQPPSAAAPPLTALPTRAAAPLTATITPAATPP
jgi:hypothetical protein